MADVHDKATRSKNMRAIATRDTAIEKRLASVLTEQGVTFRVQDATLPGRPDFVVDDYHCVIFTHGCFWHHHNCYLFKVPATLSVFIYCNVFSDELATTSALTGNRYFPNVTSTTANTITPSASHSIGASLSPPRPVPNSTATTGLT